MDDAAGGVREARTLNRIIRITEEGWEYGADQRHADLIVKETVVEKMSSLTHAGGISRSWRSRLRRKPW